MDPYAPEGLLPNLLRFVDRPGQVVRNVFRGDFGAAGRQVLDIAGELIDAPLPGDWIPSATSREDYVSGSELVGMEQKPGFARTAVDIGVGLATDPLTYLSFGAIPLAKQAAMGGKYAMEVGLPFTGGAMRTPIVVADQAMDPLSLAMRGADSLATGTAKKIDAMRNSSVAGVKPGLTEGYEGFKAWMRRAAGAENLTPGVKQRLTEATAEGSAASRLWTKQAQDAMRGLSPDERNLLTLANVGVDIGGLTPSAKVTASPLSGNFLADVDTLARKYGKDSTKLQAVAKSMGDIGSRQFDELTGKQAFFGGAPQENYLQRQWFGMDEPGAEFAIGSLPKAMKERTVTTPQQAADLLNTGDVGLELDAAKLMLNRATQQGRMLERANVARGLAPGSSATLADDLAKEARDAIKNTAGLTKDDQVALERMLGGMPARGDITGVLARLSRPVKGAMVYGVVIPKFGSLVRNKIGMGMQAAATPGVREEAIKHLNPYNIFKEMGKAWDEAYGSTVFGKADDISKDMALIDDAFKNAKQTDDVQKALNAAGRTDLADAVKHGVMDGFVSTEEMVKEIARSPNMQKLADLYNAPGKMFQHMEQRGRLMTYKSLHGKGKSTQEAAQLTKDALYDYRINSPENRALRDVVPFAQFMVKSIPQQAKWMSQRPAVAVASAPLFYDPSGEDAPVYPYMQGKSRIGYGEDAAGNQQYLTGFGLPMESIGVLPNLSDSPLAAGRDVAQGLLSSTQPVLKTLGAWATGRDPYFGTAFGSYDKIPLVGNAGDVGRIYNVAAGTGFLEPVGGGILRQLGNATDDRKTISARGLDLFTGAKLTAVDPDIAQARVISDYLEARPDVAQYRTFFKSEDDPEFSALMSELAAAKKRAKANKEAAALASP
jgi:hypothetical protein